MCSNKQLKKLFQTKPLLENLEQVNPTRFEHTQLKNFLPLCSNAVEFFTAVRIKVTSQSILAEILTLKKPAVT